MGNPLLLKICCTICETFVPFQNMLATASLISQVEVVSCLQSDWAITCRLTNHRTVLLSISNAITYKPIIHHPIITLSMLYNPFERSSRSSYINEPEPYTSVLNSRAITELQIKKPLYLINENCDYRPASSYVQPIKLQNPFGSRSSRASSYRLQDDSKKNPFVFTAPIRPAPTDMTDSNFNGLSPWEKKKYRYKLGGERNSPIQNWKYLIDSRSLEKKDLQNTSNADHILQKGDNRDNICKTDRVNGERGALSKAERIEQILLQSNNQQQKRSKGVSFSIKDSKANKVTNSGELNGLRKKFSNFENEKKQVSQSSSLINRLANINDNKPSDDYELIRMTDSKVYEYKLGSDLRGQYDDDREFNFDAGRFKQFHDDKEKLEETSKFNSYRRGENPSSITYRNTVYQFVRIF